MTESSMEWVDEPPPISAIGRGRPALYLAEALSLRERPGEWAAITIRTTAGQASNVAFSIRTNSMAAFRVGKWEAVARTVGHEHRVYARFLGDD